MDSIISVELRHILETEFNITLTSKDLRSLTFAKYNFYIFSYQINWSEFYRLEKQLHSKEEDQSSSREKQMVKTKSILDFITLPNDVSKTNVPLLKLPSSQNNCIKRKVIFFPGADGIFPSMKPLAKSLFSNVYCLQYIFKSEQNKDVESLIKTLLTVSRHLKNPTKKFRFI